MPLSRPAIAALGVALVVSATGCSSSSGGSSTGRSYAIKAGDKTCDVEKTQLAPGDVRFKVENTGSDVTEVYVYGRQNGAFTRIVGEVEDIGPGTSRDLAVSLARGTYEVACKPGMAGDGIRTTLTVTGPESATSAAGSTRRTVTAAGPSRSTEPSTPGTSTPAPPEQNSPPQRAQRAQIPAAELPGTDAAQVWHRTGRLHGLASPCLRSSLVSIGAVRQVGSTYRSAASPSDQVAQVTAVFPDEQTALTAAAVLTAWHDKCADNATAQGLRHVSVSPLADVPTSVGTGREWTVTARPEAGRPSPPQEISQGFVRDADTITFLAYSAAQHDRGSAAGTSTIDRALAVAAHYLQRSR
jgi:Cupredoxin-like domain